MFVQTYLITKNWTHFRKFHWPRDFVEHNRRTMFESIKSTLSNLYFQNFINPLNFFIPKSDKNHYQTPLPIFNNFQKFHFFFIPKPDQFDLDRIASFVISLTTSKFSNLFIPKPDQFGFGPGCKSCDIFNNFLYL